MKKLIIRSLITIGSIVLMVSSLFFVWKSIKNFQNEGDWTWRQEDNTLFYMLEEKYPNENNANFPIVMMKNQEISEKRKDEKRILIIGDSCVYGYSGTNVNYTWWKQLNLQIKKAGYSNVNIYATGKYGFNTKYELERILKNEELMKKVDPDLIIIGYVLNDPEERDEITNQLVIKTINEAFPTENFIYDKFPKIYKILVDCYNIMGDNYKKLKFMGDLLGGYRYDLWSLLIAQDESLQRYKEVLKDLDNYVNDLEIPYFYYFIDYDESKFATQAHMNVYNTMQDLGIKAYYTPYSWNEIKPNVENVDEYSQYINPVDYHPGIIYTYNYGKKVFELLKQDYKFIFENPIMEDLDKLELNINDTMPFLDVSKVKKNEFTFEYPKKELTKDKETTNFLYYPIKKDYVKLNLEYPKKISKVKITGENIKNIELYVNTINQEYGYDLDEARQVVTSCKKIDENIYEVGYEITSLNISIEFFDESNRNIKVEFIED